MTNQNQENIDLLVRAIQYDTFLFSLLSYNHRSLLLEAFNQVKTAVTDRTCLLIDAEKATESFVQKLLEHKGRILFIENFNSLLLAEDDSIIVTLNQRRDYFSEQQIILVACMWDRPEDLQKIPKKIPDLFSVLFPRVTLVKNLHKNQGVTMDSAMLSNTHSTPTFYTKEEAKTTIEAIKVQLSTIEDLPQNYNLITGLYKSLADIHYAQGDYEAARISYEKVVKLREATLPPNHPDLAASYNNVGHSYYTQGDLAKALEYFEKALKIREAIFPPNHPDLASSYNNVGNSYHHQGYLIKGLEYQKKALKIWEASLPPDHPNLATSYNNVGISYHTQGDLAKGLEYQEKALKIREAILPPNHPNLAGSSTTWGELIKQKAT